MKKKLFQRTVAVLLALSVSMSLCTSSFAFGYTPNYGWGSSSSIGLNWISSTIKYIQQTVDRYQEHVKEQIDAAAKQTTKYEIGYAIGSPTVEDNVMTVDVLTADGQTTVTTMEMDENDVYLATTKGSEKAISTGSFIEIGYNYKGEVTEIAKLFNVKNGGQWFDTVKYGAEFSPVKGVPGNVIASGWVLDKTNRTVVVGDTNHFEETYTLSRNVKVYELNTETQEITEKTLADMPVTEKTDGKYSLTPDRQMAVMVFDRNYKQAKFAQVTEIYYLTPQTKVADKYLLEEYDTMAQYSYFPDTETGGVIAKPSGATWIAYTKPFEIVKDKMYHVGDNDVACYLFDLGEDGLALLDTGWPGCGYIYMQAIEEAGYDPRDIKYLLLSHGHGDHYGTAVVFDTMLKNSGTDPVVYETYEDAVGYDIYGYPELGATLTDVGVLDIVDEYYTWEEWLDFGNGVRLYPILTPGHTNGTGSFIFEVTPDGGEAITFGYMGGFGTIHTPDQGYRRAQFVHSLRYLQQNVEVDYSLPQHNAHFPMLEINKAAEQAGISFLEAMTPGNDEWCNFLERRLVAQEMERYHVSFAEDPTISVTFPDGTVKEYETQKAAAKLQSNEKSGPWKRDAGEYKITLVDDGKLLHGFNILQNVNPLLDGIYNSNGDNLGDGVMITRDGYMHDPDQWFIQISVHVDDDYEGKFTNLTNGKNGPVESIHGDEWCEIVRTEYFDSKEEAEAVLATLKAGATYTVTMDRNSNVLLAEDIMDTFG